MRPGSKGYIFMNIHESGAVASCLLSLLDPFLLRKLAAILWRRSSSSMVRSTWWGTKDSYQQLCNWTNSDEGPLASVKLSDDYSSGWLASWQLHQRLWARNAQPLSNSASKEPCDLWNPSWVRRDMIPLEGLTGMLKSINLKSHWRLLTNCWKGSGIWICELKK